MNHKIWKELSINTTVVVSEILSEFLSLKGAEWISIDTENEVILKAYFPADFVLESLLIELNHELESLHNSGFDTGDRIVSVINLKEADWENDWKKHFTAFHVGKHLVVKPVWAEYSPQINDIVIDFDPGGFFGSTPHPSTRLCLEEIEEITTEIKDNEKFNILDLGTGSGILSLAFYFYGLKKITAIDIDPIAIRTSEENFRINKMNINLFFGELKDCNETYDIIAGNLLAEIIESLADELSQKLNKGGIFIGAGITRQKEDDVKNSLEKVGIFIEKKRYDGEWVLIRAVKK